MKITREILGEGTVRLSSDMEGIIAPSKYIQEAKRILIEASNEELRDTGSPDLLDNMLLFSELNGGRVETVIVPLNGKAVEITKDNIIEIEKRYLNRDKGTVDKSQTHINAVRDAVAEIWGDVSK